MLSAALLGLVLLGVACSKDKAKPSQAPAVNLPKSSVGEISVFPNATPDATSSTPGREVYRVAGRIPENVVSFYRAGFGFAPGDRLGICTETLTPPFELTWRVADTNDFVVVQVVGDGAADQPGSILTIIDDKANGARTCTNP